MLTRVVYRECEEDEDKTAGSAAITSFFGGKLSKTCLLFMYVCHLRKLHMRV